MSSQIHSTLTELTSASLSTTSLVHGLHPIPIKCQTQQHRLSVSKLDITFGGSGNDNPVTPVVWSNVLPKDIWTSVTVNAQVAAGTVEGATVNLTNTFEDLAYNATFDETGTVVFVYILFGNYNF